MYYEEISNSDSKCGTNLKGPDPLARCKFPFIYNNIPFKNCVLVDSPSSRNKLCQKIRMQLGSNETFPHKGISQVRNTAQKSKRFKVHLKKRFRKTNRSLNLHYITLSKLRVY